MKKIEVDEEMVSEKTIEISRLIDGLTVPEVLSIIGSVVASVVINVGDNVDGFEEIVADWLDDLSEKVLEMGEKGERNVMVN